MINETSNSRIKIDPLYDGLNLNYIDIKSDDFGIMIEKINNNFKEITNYGGGPMGPPGPQGKPGCPGEPGPPGPPGENDNNWTSSKSLACNSDVVNSLDNIPYDTINNLYSFSSLMLSNLYLDLDNGETILANVDKFDTLTLNKYSSLFNDYKLKLINSSNFLEDSFEGKHIHLLNSKAIELNNKFLCKSGFTISNDYKNNNYEVLRIKSQKQEEIELHKLDIELLADTVFFGKNINSQKFFIDSNDESNSEYKNGFILDKQTELNSVNFPNRSGYNAIWQDTKERSEKWEIINSKDLIIYRASYLNEALQQTIVPLDNNIEHWVEITDDSYVRFKRMNNFVLIDFRIGLLRNEKYNNFTLKNIMFLVNTPTLRCRTNSWYTSTVMENESFFYDSKYVNVYGFYKIEGTSIESIPSFSILNKFHYNIFNVKFTSNDEEYGENYYISGQTWATVTDEDDICDILQINQCEICPDIVINQV